MTQPDTAAQPDAGQPAAGGQQQPDATAGTQQGEQDTPLGPAGERALAALKAELAAEKARIKELQPLADKARQAEEAQKSEAQKLQEQLAAVQAERDQATRRALQLQVGAMKELPPAIAELLQGKDADEKSAHADRIMAEKPGRGPQRPPGAADAGRGSAPAGMDMNALLRTAAGYAP